MFIVQYNTQHTSEKENVKLNSTKEYRCENDWIKN